MKRFLLNSIEMMELSMVKESDCSEGAKYAYSYCPGCSDSGCTGSAQTGCKSCSSCSDWAKGKGGN